MATKKNTSVPKKSDKKNKEAASTKAKSTKTKQTIRKKLNEFGDNDAI